MERVAVRSPVACGVKVTLIVQVPPPAKLPTQSSVSAKSFGSAPEKVRLLIVSEVFSLLVTVTVLGELVVPTVTAPKEMLTGVAETGRRPVPVRLIVCGLLTALSVIVMAPVSRAAAGGSKATVIVQVELAAMLVPQVLVWL